jgi:hypothetical protein
MGEREGEVEQSLFQKKGRLKVDKKGFDHKMGEREGKSTSPSSFARASPFGRLKGDARAPKGREGKSTSPSSFALRR